MTGKSHALIGAATGVAIAYYGYMTSKPLMAVGLATSIFGAKFPDIDHHNTKLGRNRIKLFKTIKQLATIAAVLSAVLSVVSIVIGLEKSLMLVSVTALLASLIVLFVLSDTFAKKFPFLTRHRGIMHTLFVPVVTLVCCSITNNDITRGLLFGFAAGYVSHIFADSLTKERVPAVWPLSKEDVGLGFIRTNSTLEYIMTPVIAVLILAYSYLVVKSPEAVALMFVLLIIPAVKVVLLNISRQLKKIYKKKKLFILKPTTLILLIVSIFIVMALTGTVTTKVYAIGGMVGIILGIKELYYG